MSTTRDGTPGWETGMAGLMEGYVSDIPKKDHKLTMTYQHSKHCTDGKRRNYFIYFLDGVEILKQKAPYDETMDHGWQHRTHIDDVYLYKGNIHQTRKYSGNESTWWRSSRVRDEGKERKVKFPVSKKILKELGVDPNQKIVQQN